MLVQSIEAESIFYILLMGASITGSLVISFYLVLQKKISWNFGEWLSLFLIILSLLIWVNSKNIDFAIAFSVLSQVFAGIPLTIKTYNEPEKGYLLGYGIFILSCLLPLLVDSPLNEFNLKNHLLPIALGLHTLVDCMVIIVKTKRFGRSG